jgi:hypothetical protein
MTNSTDGPSVVTPPTNLTSLRARLRNHARNIHQVETRVQRRLAATSSTRYSSPSTWQRTGRRCS